MYYVIQTESRKENIIMEKIKSILDSSLYDDIFIPTRERLRKNDGKWTKYYEICFPGYIFIETKYPGEVNRIIRYNIDDFGRVVSFGSNGNFNYICLSELEEKVIRDLMGKNKCIELSSISIEEGKIIKVISGPLMGYEGKVKKYNLHKRTVLVELDLGGIKNEFQLGVDVIK